MKIIQISAVRNDSSTDDIYGLGDDGALYLWDYQTKTWKVA